MNKIKVLLILCLSVLGIPLSAQGFGFEAGIGGNYAFNRMFYDKNVPGLSGYLEASYSLSSIPLTIGARVQGDGFSRVSKETIARDGVGGTFFSYRFFLTSDRVWALSHTSSFFAGVGAGIAYCRRTKNYKFSEDMMTTTDDGNKYPFSIMPRVGYILNGKYRFSLSYVYGDSANSFLCLHVGFIL